MHVGAQPCVISQIPAGMIRVFVNHDGIGGPQPVGDIWIVKGCHAEVPAVKPETFAIAALQMKHVARSKPPGKVAMLKWTIQMKTGVISGIVMSHPLPV